jgi:putative xylitol transport system permease protein
MTLVSKTITASQVELNAGGHRHRFKHLIGDYGLIVVFLICFVLLSIGTTSFLTVGNLINVIRQSSIIGFIALGMTFVMITAGIDLSVGSISA